MKKEFGLAAQLARGRPANNIAQQTPLMTEEEGSQAGKPLDILEQIEESAPVLPTQPSTTKPIGRSGGRPRRAEETQRMTLVLSRELAEYLDGAWRTHRRTNGQYVNGPSAFIEELLRMHRGG